MAIQLRLPQNLWLSPLSALGLVIFAGWHDSVGSKSVFILACHRVSSSKKHTGNNLEDHLQVGTKAKQNFFEIFCNSWHRHKLTILQGGKILSWIHIGYVLWYIFVLLRLLKDITQKAQLMKICKCACCSSVCLPQCLYLHSQCHIQSCTLAFLNVLFFK